jgi:hypothetical protein
MAKTKSQKAGEVRKCLRCGHTWTQRLVGVKPIACAACKSAYWDREPVQAHAKKFRK